MKKNLAFLGGSKPFVTSYFGGVLMQLKRIECSKFFEYGCDEGALE
jgi:hypothetical protein